MALKPKHTALIQVSVTGGNSRRVRIAAKHFLDMLSKFSMGPAIELKCRAAEPAPDIAPYRKLREIIEDCISGKRLKKGDLPDDFEAIRVALKSCKDAERPSAK